MTFFQSTHRIGDGAGYPGVQVSGIVYVIKCDLAMRRERDGLFSRKNRQSRLGDYSFSPAVRNRKDSGKSYGG